MESKLFLIATLIGGSALLFTMIPDEKYHKKPKDKITLDSEKYLERLKHENEELVDSLKKRKLARKNVNNSTGNKKVR